MSGQGAIDFRVPVAHETPQASGTPERIDYGAELARVKAALAPYEGKIAELAQVADAMVVENDDQNVEATEIAGQVKQAIKRLEAARKDFVEDAFQYKKAVDGLANGFKAKLKKIEATLKGKITQYVQKKELERRKAEAEARRKAEEENARLRAEAEAQGVEPVEPVEPIIPKAETKTRTAAGTSYQHTEWRFEIIDPKKVPRTYCTPDEKLIRQAVRNGIRKMAGVHIYEHTETRIRT